MCCFNWQNVLNFASKHNLHHFFVLLNGFHMLKCITRWCSPCERWLKKSLFLRFHRLYKIYIINIFFFNNQPCFEPWLKIYLFFRYFADFARADSLLSSFAFASSFFIAVAASCSWCLVALGSFAMRAVFAPWLKIFLWWHLIQCSPYKNKQEETESTYINMELKKTSEKYCWS